MDARIDQIKALQGKVISLLHEYELSRKVENLLQQHGKYYLIRDGFLFDHSGKILVDTCNGMYPGRINSFLRLRNIKSEIVLNQNDYTS